MIDPSPDPGVHGPADAIPTSSVSDAPLQPPGPRPAPGPRRLRSLLIGSIIATVLAVALFVGLRPRSGTGPSTGPVVGVGSVAPDFTLPSLTGGPAVNLDALGMDRRHPVVLNFFASWCGPCREETPLVARTARAEHAEGSKIQFIGVDTLDPKSSALPFVQKAGITYPVATDNGTVSSGLYGLYGDPQTFFIDADGRVIGHVSGALKAAELAEWLHRLGAPITPT